MSTSNGHAAKIRDCTEGLAEQEWYWGDTTKEILAAAMENAQDGTYAVRTASTKGDFTLTIRTGGATKLVRIRVSTELAKCGFTQKTMEFDSVVELLEYYKGTSLKEFNEALDVRLQYPLQRPDNKKKTKVSEQRNTSDDVLSPLGKKTPEPAEEPITARASEATAQPSVKRESQVFDTHPECAVEQSVKKAPLVLKHQLEGMHAEYERVSQRYDHLFEQRTEYAEQISRKNQAFAAYGDGEKEYAKQIERLKRNVQTYSNEANAEDVVDPNDKLITESLQAMEETARSMREQKKEAKRWVTALEAAMKTLDDELDYLRPRLVHAHKKRDECTLKLRDHNVHEDHIENILLDVSSILVLEAERTTLTLLQIPLKWDAETWFTTDRNKESAQKAIHDRMKKLPEDATNGVFLVRPSQTRSGFFALSISMGRGIQSALIEYKDPASGGDRCGYGFHNTDMFFSTLPDFVRYYTAYPLKEHNPVLDTTLSIPAFASDEDIEEALNMH